MPFKLNPITGTLDLVNNSSAGSGDVVGPASATDNAITRYDGTTGKLIQDSLAILDDGGTITAQEFVFNRQIINDITIPDNYSMFSTDMELVTGNILLLGTGEVVLI